MKKLKKIIAACITAAMTTAVLAVPAMAEQIRGLTFTPPMDLEKYKSQGYSSPWVMDTGWADDNGILKTNEWIEYCYTTKVQESPGSFYYYHPEEIWVQCIYDRGIYSISDLDANGWLELYNDVQASSSEPQISNTNFEQHNGVDFFRMDYTLNGLTFIRLYAPSESGDVFSIIYKYSPSTGIAQQYEQDFWDVLDTVSLKQRSGSSSSGGTAATLAPAPTSGKNAEDYHLLTTTFNSQKVYNGPTETASFNIDKDTMLQAITTYHYNGGSGKAPGTISLLENGIKVGEWQAYGRNGNTYWDAFPDYVLKGGNYYTIVDSDNGTWSYNSASYDMGFIELRGYGMGTSSGGTANNTAANNDVIKIYVNGSRVYPDSDPVIINDRTLVPIRVIAEALGYAVEWDGLNQVVEIHNDYKALRMMIGSTSLALYFYDSNGNLSGMDTIYSDVAPRIMNERTYLPVRAVSEGLGASVDWDGNTRSVYISK